MNASDEFDIGIYTPELNDEDVLKETYLSSDILKFILNIDNFDDNVIKPKKETYTATQTERERKLQIDNDELKEENEKLKTENEQYKNLSINQKSQEVNKIIATVQSYNDRERETHLQAICFLAFRLAEQDPKKFIKPSNNIYTDRIASILEKESLNHCINLRTKDVFQRKLSNSIKLFRNTTEKAD
ncbi:TPA: hypothetical protein ACPI87_000187 [Haemophilus influenzae]|uniref:hypothetical protein n=1 Tax=Haemophilus influenzae TaxID=727 RepID=UPI000F6B7ED6|nr:hypothetical protein [Haemophilus influenzae]VEI53859.1 Uncharacterised protein [Haemophilus influenzae]